MANNRVNGRLAVTRALGDMGFKDMKCKPRDQARASPCPEPCALLPHPLEPVFGAPCDLPRLVRSRPWDAPALNPGGRRAHRQSGTTSRAWS